MIFKRLAPLRSNLIIETQTTIKGKNIMFGQEGKNRKVNYIL